MNLSIKMEYTEEWNPILKKLIIRRSIINYEHLDKVEKLIIKRRINNHG